MDLAASNQVALARMAGPARYPPPSAAPYSPDEAYPEFPSLTPSAPGTNPVFAMVRNVLRDMQLDAPHYGTPQWNPLGDLVPPGGKIVVKPNWVLHRNMGSGGMDCMITHPSVLRAVLEYAFLAKPSLVTLGDAPLQGCDFNAMLDYAAMHAVIDQFRARGLPLVLTDFRRTITSETASGVKTVREDFRGEDHYVLADLGADSLLEPISRDWKRFRVTVYDPRKMWNHHAPGRHRFLLAREVFEADLILNCPKLKAHKKAGVTCCLKNLIGINGNKEYLPHHRKGSVEAGRGGDSHPQQSWLVDMLESALDVLNKHRQFEHLYAFGERVIYYLERRYQRRVPHAQMEGNWYGNDTIWRTCLDLNRALLYADTTGRLHDRPQRRELSIVDAIVCGQGEGPLEPLPLATGAIFAACNPAIGDHLACRLLHFDAVKIPLVQHSLDAMRWPLCTVRPDFSMLPDLDSFPPAEPAQGWKNHIEDTP